MTGAKTVEHLSSAAVFEQKDPKKTAECWCTQDFRPNQYEINPGNGIPYN